MLNINNDFISMILKQEPSFVYDFRDNILQLMDCF
jgi:hypothetical protein